VLRPASCRAVTATNIQRVVQAGAWHSRHTGVQTLPSMMQRCRDMLPCPWSHSCQHLLRRLHTCLYAHLLLQAKELEACAAAKARLEEAFSRSMSELR
jgi:hypothetical protein